MPIGGGPSPRLYNPDADGIRYTRICRSVLQVYKQLTLMNRLRIKAYL